MTAAPESPAPSRSCFSRFGCLVLALVGLPLFFFLMMAGIGIGVADLTITVLFGWISFIRDVWPRISWDFGSILTVILCSALILFLGHWFLDWLSRGIASAKGKTFRWPMKWTACAFGAIALCFLIGMAVAGAAHQIGWIAENDEPLYEQRPRAIEHYREVQEMRYMLAGCLNGTDTVQSLRACVQDAMKERRGRSSYHRPNIESVHLLMLVNSNAQVEGVIVFPRDKEARQRWGGEFETHTNDEPWRADVLSEFIKSNEANLIAF
jgi:hypothetical protein